MLNTRILSVSLILILYFTSCSTISGNIGFIGLVILSVILLTLFVLTFVFIIKRKSQVDKSLNNFNQRLQLMLNGLDTMDKKVEALNTVIKRINEDEQYKKDEEWKNKVLAKTYLHLATLYHHANDVDNTINICSKILELTPDDAMTLYNRGSMYSNIGQFDDALSDLDKSIELVDNYPSSYNNRGMVLAKLGRYTDAMVNFEKAIELEESPVIYLNRAITYRDMDKAEESLTDLKKALAICDESDVDIEKEIQLEIEKLTGQCS